MPRPPALTQREKTMLILQVLSGECNLAQAAARVGVSAQAVANWRRQFVEAGSAGLRSRCHEAGPRTGELRMRQLVHEVTELKVALADAHLALQVQSGVRSARADVAVPDPGRAAAG